MDKLLKVYDNIVDENIVFYLRNLILGHIPNSPFPLYVTTGLSQDPTNLDFGFNNDFSNCDDHLPTILQPLFFLSTKNKINIKSIDLHRVFLQLPLIEKVDHVPHVDLTKPHWVCLYYVNDSDGDTIFYGDDGEIIKTVSPKAGRIALFDGSIKHSAGKPTKNERIVINICFNGEFYE